MFSKIKKITFCMGMIFCCAFTLFSCSSGDSIIGTWKLNENSNGISFYEDGTCLNVAIRTATSADAVSYKIQDDGKMILTMEWDGNMVLEKTEDKEEALSSLKRYYLSGDTLVIGKKEYKKE